jgi:hypothetical protein
MSRGFFVVKKEPGDHAGDQDGPGKRVAMVGCLAVIQGSGGEGPLG